MGGEGDKGAADTGALDAGKEAEAEGGAGHCPAGGAEGDHCVGLAHLDEAGGDGD